MKHLFVTLACFALANTQAQTPYNPDSDGDNLIGVYDLVDFLPLYGNPFFPDGSQPIIEIIGPDALINVDTIAITSSAAQIELNFFVDSLTDVVLIEVDPLRLAMDAQFSSSGVYLDIFIQLPQLNTFKNVAIAYTGEFEPYNGTSIQIKVKDDDLLIETFNTYFPKNRFRPFVHMANQWFSVNGPNSD